MQITGLVLLFLGLVFQGWLITGYSKSRRLEPEIGNIYYYGIGKMALGHLYVENKLPWWLAVIPLPWPFVQIYPLLMWEEWVDDLSKANEKLPDGSDKYKQVRKIDGKGFMGVRKERVPFLKLYEHVNYDFKVVTGDKYEFTLIASFTFKITEPMVVIRYPSFKMIGYDLTSSYLGPLIHKKEVNEIYDINFDTLAQLKEDGKTIEQILDKKFEKSGFDLYTKDMDIIESKEVLDYFKLKNEEKELDQETVNATKEGQVRKAQREVEYADAQQEIKIMEETMKANEKGMSGFIQKLYKGKAMEKAARKDVLVEVNHEADEVGEELTRQFFSRLPNPSKTTSSKKFERRDRSIEKEKLDEAEKEVTDEK